MYDLGQPLLGNDDEYYAAYCSGPVDYIYYLLACSSENRFLGCCTDQSGCADDCASGNLGNFSLSADQNGIPQSFTSNIQKQSCTFGSQWYTCSESEVETNFVGCCLSNPCANGCPNMDITPSFLSNDRNAGDFFSGLNASSMVFSIPSETPSPIPVWANSEIAVPSSIPASTSASSTRASTGSSSRSSTERTSSTSMSPPAATTSQDHATSNNMNSPANLGATGVIAGSVTGGVAGLLLIVALVIFLFRRKTNKSVEHANNRPRAPSVQGDGDAETKADIPDDNTTVASAPAAPQKLKEDNANHPSVSPLELPRFTYTAYSRPFSELDSGSNHQISSRPPNGTAPPSRDSAAGSSSPHPYPIPGGYSDGVGQAQ